MLMLKKFTIEKLNGDQFVSIDFVDNKKVVVAENGSGKTTIMNILYYCLKNNINGLKKYDFEVCILEFADGKEITFEKNKLDEIDSNEDFRSFVRLKTRDRNIIFSKIENLTTVAEKFLINSGVLSLERFLVDFVTYLMDIQDELIVEHANVDNNRSNIYKILKKHGFPFELIDTHLLIDKLSQIKYKDLRVIYFYMERDPYFFDREAIYNFNNHYERGRTRNNKDFNEIFKNIIRHFVIDNIKDKEEEKKLLNTIKIIFLPTYRRIEQDSIDLLSGEFSIKEGSILSFGINDVILLFNKISEKISNFSQESFNKINSSALNDLISGEYNTDGLVSNWVDKDEEYFNSVLQRVGTQIGGNNHEKLKKIFIDRNDSNTFLVTIINRMCEIYDKQLKIENEIMSFINVCNKYLFNKEIIYDRTSLKIKIKKYKKNGTPKEIKLSSLSSGEKQIISIFAKLYLSHLPDVDIENNTESNSGYWILFDEPELSLSVDWQEILLPDILASKRCDFLFATTHSPFIFNNDLRFYTSSINECIEEI